MPAQGPVHEIRLGKIRATIWGNGGDETIVWYSITVTRLYKDGDTWKDTASFRRDDLPIVSKLTDLAYAWIWDHQ